MEVFATILEPRDHFDSDVSGSVDPPIEDGMGGNSLPIGKIMKSRDHAILDVEANVRPCKRA
jgi:hypothetical protein